MRFAFSSPAGDADLVVLRTSTADCLGDVAVAVTRAASPDVLYVDHRPVSATMPLGASGLLDGSRLSTEPTEREQAMVVLVQLTGSGAGARRVLSTGTYVLGLSRHDSVGSLGDGSVAAPRASIDVEPSGMVRVRSSFAKLDGQPCPEPTEWVQQILTLDGRHFRLDSPFVESDSASPQPVVRGRVQHRRPALVPPVPPEEAINVSPSAFDSRERDLLTHTLAHHHHRAMLSARSRHPDLAQALRWTVTPSSRLWERRPWRPDAFLFPLGLADLPWTPAVTGEASGLTATIDRLGPLPSVPVAVDLIANRGIGIAAPDEVALAVARAAIVSMAVLHGPADLPIVVLTDEVRAPMWEWVKWLPHSRHNGDVQIHWQEGAVAAWVHRHCTEPAAKGAEHQVTLVVTDQPLLWTTRSSALRPLLANPSLPARLLALASDSALLPPVCTTVLNRNADGTFAVESPYHSSAIPAIGASQLDPATCLAAVRRLARWDDPDHGMNASDVSDPDLSVEVPLVAPWVVSRQLSAIEHRLAIRCGMNLVVPAEPTRAVAADIAPTTAPPTLGRRGDGIGVELAPTAITGVRLDAATVGRIHSAVTIPCNTADDDDLRRALHELRVQLRASELPTVVSTWTERSALQSVDVTGFSAQELRNLRNEALDSGFDVLLGHRPAVRQWWTFYSGLEALVRAEYAANATGFHVMAREPSPISAARLFTDQAVAATIVRSDGNGFVVFAHGGVLHVAMPTRLTAATGATVRCSGWQPIGTQHRWLLDDRDRSALLDAVDASPTIPLHLDLVGDPVPDYAEVHAAHPPKIIVALGAALRAAGLASRQPTTDIMVNRTFVESADRTWALEMVADVVAPTVERPNRLRRVLSRR
jgi:hypothetical protein